MGEFASQADAANEAVVAPRKFGAGMVFAGSGGGFLDVDPQGGSFGGALRPATLAAGTGGADHLAAAARALFG